MTIIHIIMYKAYTHLLHAQSMTIDVSENKNVMIS